MSCEQGTGLKMASLYALNSSLLKFLSEGKSKLLKKSILSYSSLIQGGSSGCEKPAGVFEEYEICSFPWCSLSPAHSHEAALNLELYYFTLLLFVRLYS